MVLAGEGWRHDFGIVTLTLQICTIVACAYIIKRYPNHQILQGRDLNVARITVLAQICFTDHSWNEVWGEQWLPCPAFYYLHVVGVPIYVFSQVSNGMRLLNLFEYNEMKKMVTDRKQLSDQQIQRLKRLQQMLSPRFIMMRFIALTCACWVVVTIVLVACGRPYFTLDYGCRLTPPPWESLAPIVTRTFVDPLVIGIMSMLIVAVVPSIWVALRMREYYKRGASETLGLINELVIGYGGLIAMFGCCMVIIYSKYSIYATTYNWIQLPALTPMCCALYFVVLPTIRQSQLVTAVVRHLHPNRAYDASLTTVDKVLQDRRGFVYLLLQCRSEFSEENIVALKAIWQFQSAPTFTAMMEIYQAFIEDGAVLQVNISNAARNRVAQLVHSHTPASLKLDMADVFKEVETEVMKLVESNSWVRFKQSGMYQRYLDGELPPNCTQADIDALANESTTRHTHTSQHNGSVVRSATTQGHQSLHVDEYAGSAWQSHNQAPKTGSDLHATPSKPAPRHHRQSSLPIAMTPMVSHGVIIDVQQLAAGKESMQADAQLEAEAEALFRPRARNSSITVNMQAHKVAPTTQLTAQAGQLPRQSVSRPAVMLESWTQQKDLSTPNSHVAG